MLYLYIYFIWGFFFGLAISIEGCFKGDKDFIEKNIITISLVPFLSIVLWPIFLMMYIVLSIKHRKA